MSSSSFGQFRQPWAVWRRALVETWTESGNDNLSLIAAGVAFYAFVAIVPVLAAIVLTYGLVASPETVIANVRSLTQSFPPDAAKLIGGQLLEVAHTSDGKKGIGLLVALAIAIWGARNAASAVIVALNVAYEVKERRGFVALTLLAVGMTVIAVLVAVAAGAATAVLTYVQSFLPTGEKAGAVIGTILSYAVLLLASATAAALLYRFAPDQRTRRWVWLTPGSAAFSLGWLALTVGFGFYVANFGNYGATYGSLSAIIVLLTWLYLSAYLLLLGGELNGEMAKLTGEGAKSPAAEAPASIVAAPPAHGDAPIGDYAVSRATSRVAGSPRVGLATSGLATLGLVWLRRPNRAAAGLALLVSAAGLSWLRRDPA